MHIFSELKMAESQQINDFREKLRENKVFRLGVVMFIAHVVVFFFVELKSLRSQSFIASFVTTIILASIVLIMGILTVIPQFTLYVGRTQIIFSALIISTKAVEILAGRFGIFSIIEMLIGATSFLYGYELVRKFRHITQTVQPMGVQYH